MKRGKLPPNCTTKRDAVETMQIVLIDLRIDMDEVLIRLQQAMRRSDTVTDVLQPGIDTLKNAMRDIDDLQDALRKYIGVQHQARWL